MRVWNFVPIGVESDAIGVVMVWLNHNNSVPIDVESDAIGVEMRDRHGRRRDLEVFAGRAAGSAAD